MGTKIINATPLYGYVVKDTETLVWLAGAETPSGAKRAATHREPGGELKLYRMSVGTARLYLVSTRRVRGVGQKWINEPTGGVFISLPFAR